VRRVVIVPVLLLAAAGLAACGSSSSSKGGGGGSPYGGGSSSKTSSTTSGASTGGGTAVDLSAKDFAYTPTSLSVPSGGSVKFTNTGSVEHNVTVDGQSVSKDAEAGESATIKVDLPAGSYKFHCKYHPTQMKGTLTVGS
jgi:plastocyanin